VAPTAPQHLPICPRIVLGSEVPYELPRP
jgi:hypothetical protein